MPSKNIKKNIVKMIYKAGVSHIGACLSIADILYVLYFKVLNVDPQNPLKTDRDKFILSKGHASAALYSTLAVKGFFPIEYLDKFATNNGILPCHLDMCSVPGIETSTGSLGHGLSIGLGMAIANKQSKNSGNIYVLVGDGECNEGSIWEAAMLASTLKLDNLTVIVDYNNLQGFGRTNDIIDQKNLSERWKTFGWESFDIDGHNEKDLQKVFELKSQKPKAIIAHTIKGKGVSFMEDKLEWHYKSPNKEQYCQALEELDASKYDCIEEPTKEIKM